MPTFTSLSIRTRLLASFGVVVALLLAVGLLAISKLGSLDGKVNQLAARVVPATDIVGQASAAMNKYRKDELHYILSTPAERAGAAGVSGDLAGDLQTMAGLLASYRNDGLVADATDGRLLDAFRNAFADYVAKTAHSAGSPTMVRPPRPVPSSAVARATTPTTRSRPPTPRGRSTSRRSPSAPPPRRAPPTARAARSSSPS